MLRRLAIFVACIVCAAALTVAGALIPYSSGYLTQATWVVIYASSGLLTGLGLAAIVRPQRWWGWLLLALIAVIAALGSLLFMYLAIIPLGA